MYAVVGKDWKCLLHTAIQQMAVALYSMDMDTGQCTHVFLWHSEGHFEAELNVRGVVLYETA